MKENTPGLLIVTGATASGKTGFASLVASKLGGEIISADSRQVYRKMDLGTGKDYDDYIINGSKVPFHLIDIVDPGYKYNVFEYQQDFLSVYNDIISRNKVPVVCGGSGMYLDSIVRGYKLVKVPPNEDLRQELESLSMTELVSRLKSYPDLHNSTDLTNRKRATRAIEINEYYLMNPDVDDFFPAFNSIIVAIKYDRNSRRKRISERLTKRLDEGMVEEVKMLLGMGISPEDLIYYGLEYKFLTLYLSGDISYDEMTSSLETAIHQFAKRQMTWFRGMERRGIKIHWLDGYMPDSEKLDFVLGLLR